MATLTQVVNGEYIGADKYTIQDAGDGKSTVTFSPDQVLKEGTQVGAELLNEIQKNGLYYLVGTHRVDGQESIYDCTLVGIDTFEFTQLNVLFKPNTSPTQATVKLNISGQIYTLTEKLINANQIGLLLVKSEMKAYTWGTKVTIVNDLTTGGADNALSAEQGVVLNRKIDSLDICPYKVGDIYQTTNSSNPSTIWLGTTWQKLEDVVIKATSSSNPTTKVIIGSDTVAINKENLPNIKLGTTAHTHTDSGHTHVYRAPWTEPSGGYIQDGGSYPVQARTSDVGKANITSSAPITEALGSGVKLNIVQKSYIANMWLRTA